MKKQTLQGRLTLGAALGVLALAPMAQAQDTSTSSMTTTTTGTMSGGMSGAGMSGGMSGTMSSQPMMVTGRVNNYWTDQSGYVTAMDIQTANGPAVVHFSPGMGNRLMQTFPIGSTANVWVQGSMYQGTQRWDLVGVGDKMPASGFWPVTRSEGLDLVTGWPMVESGAERVTVDGKLRRVVVDKMGQVVGLVVETQAIYRGTPKTVLLFGKPGDGSTGETLWESSPGRSDENADIGGNNSVSRDTTAAPDTSAAGAMTGTGVGAGGNTTSVDATGTMSGGGMTGGMMAVGPTGGAMWTLIRVGQEFRPAPNHSNNMRRVTPLVAGDEIRATGYMESTPYGASSVYGRRLASSAISVNGRGVGQLGFPQMNPSEPVLLGFNLNLPFITGSAPDTLQVVPGGYEVYSGSTGSTSGTMMTAPSR